MDALKKWFPLSFQKSGSIGDLIVGIIIYLVVGVIAGLAIGFAGVLTGWIPLLGDVIAWVLRVVAALVDIYVVAGIVIQVLAFLKILK